ncbi:hypothetical protein GYMLUDRAFT_160576, partial [Collybiopsis luxurians FD-317 M1]
MTTNPNALPNLIIFPEDQQLIGLSNWAVFCNHMLSVARSTGLGGYLNGTISNPTTTASPTAGAHPSTPIVTPINSCNPSSEEWDLHDSQLARIVYQNIKDPCSIGVTQDMTSNVMWTTLTGQ